MKIGNTNSEHVPEPPLAFYLPQGPNPLPEPDETAGFHSSHNLRYEHK